MTEDWLEGMRSLLEAPSPARDVTSARRDIAGRYLGALDGGRFADARRAKPGVLFRLVPAAPRVWDLSAMLPV